jgi:predicted nuclease of predicted toxin-antitoxin system
MLFKVDENLPPFIAARLRDAGHEAVTVADQALSGASDEELAPRCKSEGRILVTLDLDFADIRAYPPGSCPGFVVLRLDGQDRADFERATALLLAALQTTEVSGALWIVESDRIRVRDAGL